MNFKLTSVDPLDSNIGIHILCNVLSAFTKMLTGRISPTIKSFFFFWLVIISFILLTLMCDSVVIL